MGVDEREEEAMDMDRWEDHGATPLAPTGKPMFGTFDPGVLFRFHTQFLCVFRVCPAPRPWPLVLALPPVRSLARPPRCTIPRSPGFQSPTAQTRASLSV